MPDIIFTLTTDGMTRVVDGIAGRFGYQEMVLDENDLEIPNPETKNQFAKRKLVWQIKKWLIEYEEREQLIASSNAISTDVNNNLDIT